MPEGHSIFRYAAEHRALFEGREVEARSPQGRFRKGAERISGRTLRSIDTHGKHLFYRWQRAETLHIHLGLYGKFRTFATEPPLPTPGTRLTLASNGTTVYLAGPTVCELITPSQEEAVRARLGPDPLQSGTRGNTAAEFVTRLSRRSIPIGAAILDQGVIAGLGNIYRAEALFLLGIDPTTPANELDSALAVDLWKTSVRLLKRGAKQGKIVTVPRPGRGAKTDNLYVYKRERRPCRKCGGSISVGEMAGRTIWWCGACQT